MAKRKVTRKKIVRKNIADGVVHIAATFNNTMVTVTDNAGNAIAWSSAGNLGFKGSKKSTPFAAQAAVEDAMQKAMEHGIKNVGIKIQGLHQVFSRFFLLVLYILPSYLLTLFFF